MTEVQVEEERKTDRQENWSTLSLLFPSAVTRRGKVEFLFLSETLSIIHWLLKKSLVTVEENKDTHT